MKLDLQLGLCGSELRIYACVILSHRNIGNSCFFGEEKLRMIKGDAP